MNHGELRTKVREHFKAILEKAKTRRDEIGPYTELEKERIVDTIRLHETDNEEYWELLGRDHARSELDKFCNGTGVKQPKSREDAFLILGEIKKAQLALAKTLLEHNKTFEKYDFDEPPSAPVSPAESVQPSSGDLNQSFNETSRGGFWPATVSPVCREKS
ncbi:hypothetical protein [Ruegeria lacuscaerulensis]|uniref:hypothetical protein n=1 Tax=Ruegeria lacuscaerulensis TaxID=55218 RepID=UPI00147CC904|nr:hypothetical protein [Ruegeria lacuscaerulensis]